MNPLFSDEPFEDDKENSYVLSRSNKSHVRPLSHVDNPAVEMIRHKIDAMYGHEPNARQEMTELEQLRTPRTKHQEFMHKLTVSGKSMAEIQAAWHTYYASLSDAQKHQVWQEFYQANANARQHNAVAERQPHPALPHGQIVVSHHQEPENQPPKPDRRSVASIKKELLQRVRSSHSAQQKARQNLQSLAFGLGLGALTLLIVLFGLFNELVITPFIRPGSAAATPIILNTDAPAPSATPEVIIPKLNAQLPVIYGGQSLAEAEVQKALNDGVFHYPTTATPGQNGNVAIFGHSSNNIFNKGKYKFAFVLLRELEPGDIFYMTYAGKVYTYKVYSKKIVNPEDTWILGPAEGKTATATLITCDPPGTTRHRLAVWGEQISPDPTANNSTATPSEALQTQALPDNGPSVWTRFWHWLNPFAN
jgi:LPXTG-site transpeptidase (sortase) family protein